MPYNPDFHHRHSIRLKTYDYSQPGAYFVTICTWNKECVFGEISRGQLELNDIGRIVEKEWLRTGNIRTNVELDVHVIMPNHFHGILIIHNDGRAGYTDRCRGVSQYAPTNQTFRSPSNSLGAIVRGFKSAATSAINQNRNTPGVPVWQRNYYEHVIRSEDDLNTIRQYIMNNPLRWGEDDENPIKGSL